MSEVDTSADDAADKLGKIVNHEYAGEDVVLYDCDLATVSFNDVRALLAERDTLIAQLSQARSDALEEAAKSVESEVEMARSLGALSHIPVLNGIAKDIRALKEPTP